MMALVTSPICHQPRSKDGICLSASWSQTPEWLIQLSHSSLKAENFGNDPNISLVPASGGGWGSQQPQQPTGQQQQQQQQHVDNHHQQQQHQNSAVDSLNNSTGEFFSCLFDFYGSAIFREKSVRGKLVGGMKPIRGKARMVSAHLGREGGLT